MPHPSKPGFSKAPKPPASGIATADHQLRDKIQKFAFEARFHADADRALVRFFGKAVARTRQIVADEGDIPEFQEWFFFDFQTRSGETIIDIFARELGPDLSQQERELLDSWRRWNRYRLFEVQEVKPGVGVVVTDLLSEETIEVQDRSASRGMKRWEIFLGRPIYTDRLHFTGGGIPLQPRKKQAVLDYSRKLLANFRKRHPQATLDEFYQRHGLDIRQFMKRKAEERPVWVTPEGHPLAFCSAVYRVTDAEAVFQRLDGAEELVFAGDSDDYPGALHFNWLLRGRSRVPEQPKPSGEVLVHEVSWFLDENSPRYRSLGDVMLWPNRLELSCISKARLRAGKKLLEHLLGLSISHQEDWSESIEERMARQPTRPSSGSARSDPTLQALDRKIFEEQMEHWLDEPVVGFGGQTPREAVRTPEGRAKVIEALKMFEYTQAQRREDGEMWYEIDRIRKELGLPVP
jgi:hypothetical protein